MEAAYPQQIIVMIAASSPTSDNMLGIKSPVAPAKLPDLTLLVPRHDDSPTPFPTLTVPLGINPVQPFSENHTMVSLTEIRDGLERAPHGTHGRPCARGGRDVRYKPYN